MYRLLIVDDERNIRIGLKAMIEREYPSRFSIGLAAGGEEALEMHRAEKADIVVTDIRMPGMDGLELIRKLGELPFPPAVMILSGYDDFQYAKEAIAHKVREYLLKPIVREELFRALNRMIAELRQEEQVARELEALGKYREEQAADQLNYILLHPDIPEDEIERRCAKAGLDPAAAPYCVAVVRKEDQPSGTLAQLAEAYWKNRQSICFEDKDRNLVVLAGDETAVTDFARDVQGKGLRADIGVSLKAAGAAQLKRGYQEAKQALKYAFLHARPGGGVFYYADVRRLPKPDPIPEELFRRLANLLGTGRKQDIKELWHEIMDLGEIKRRDIAYLERLSRMLNEMVIDRVFADYGEASVEILKIYKKIGYLYHSETVYGYIHDAEALLLRLDDYVKDVKEAHVGHAEMKAAVDYIREHYDKPLNMATVSNHVSLNYSYFSETFKQFTGMSFVPYVKKIRIEKAKELLEHSHGKVYEIAAQVGFESVKQFNRVFREHEGISPMEYREKAWAHAGAPNGSKAK